MRITNFGRVMNVVAWISVVIFFVAIDTAVANDELVAQTGKLRGEVKIDGEMPKVPPLKIQPQRMLVIPRNQADKDRNQREIETSPVVEIPDDTLVVGERGGVANVVVYLQQAPAGWTPTPPQRQPAVLEGLEYRTAPHVSLIRVGQSLTLKAATKSAESYQFEPLHSQAQNRLVPANSEVTIEVPFQKPERTPVRINHPIHAWKQAWLMPLDHPFAAITNQEGQFDISGLPPGEHLFHIWHERNGWLEKKLAVRIAAGRTAEVNLKYPAERFEIKSNAAKPQKPAAEILKLRDDRRQANDRDAARKLIGNWRLTLPRGFEYELSLTITDDGCLSLHGRQAGNLLGTFAVNDGRMWLVRSSHEGILDYVWKINDEQSLTLIESDTRVGSSYVGAKLQRIKPATP